MRAQIFQTQFYIALSAEVEIQNPERTARLRGNRRKRRPAYSPAETAHKKPVQEHVGAAAYDDCRHRIGWSPLGTDEIVYAERNFLEYQSAYDYRVIRSGERQNALGRAKERQQFVHEQKRDGRRARVKRKEQKYRLPEDFLRALPVALAEFYGKERCAALPHRHCYREQKQRGRETYGDCSKSVLAAYAPDENPVDNIVSCADNRGDDCGRGKLEDEPPHSHTLKCFYGFVVHTECGILSTPLLGS